MGFSKESKIDFTTWFQSENPIQTSFQSIFPWKVIQKIEKCLGKSKKRGKEKWKKILRILTISKKFRWKSWIFSKMKSQGYWWIFIRIMRKYGFFVKGYPFDWTNSKTNIFHNHPLNLIKSVDFKNCKLFKSITRTKW